MTQPTVDMNAVVKARLGELEFENCSLRAQLQLLATTHAQCPQLELVPVENAPPVALNTRQKKPDIGSGGAG